MVDVAQQTSDDFVRQRVHRRNLQKGHFSWDVVLVGPTAGVHTLRSVLHASQEVDDGFHKTPAGTYELVVNFTVEAAPATALPETGGTGLTGTLPLWLGVGGLLLLALGLGLRRVAGHMR